MNSKLRAFLVIFIGLAIMGTTGAWIPRAAATALKTDGCECLVYFQNNQHLPQTGQANFPAFQYGDAGIPNALPNLKTLNAPKGYFVRYLSPSYEAVNGWVGLIFTGTAIVFQPGHFQAGPSGHIGLVLGAAYNYEARHWTFRYKDANGWTGNGPDWSISAEVNPVTKSIYFNESLCPNVAIRDLVTTSWDGLRFFAWQPN